MGAIVVILVLFLREGIIIPILRLLPSKQKNIAKEKSLKFASKER